MARRAWHTIALSLLTGAMLWPTAADALSCEYSAPRPGLFAWPYGELPTQPLLRLHASGHFAETVEAIGGAVQAHMVAEDHAVPLEIAETRRTPAGRWSLETVWADVRPIRPLAPRTGYILHLILPGGRVHVVGRDAPQVWTTADGPDVIPPRIVRAPLPVAEWYDGAGDAFLQVPIPTVDDSTQRLELVMRELPADGAGRRAVDPTPRTLWAPRWTPGHVWIGQRGCSTIIDVLGAERRFSMHITAVDAAGNRTRVPGVVFDGIDPDAERSSSRRARR